MELDFCRSILRMSHKICQHASIVFARPSPDAKRKGKREGSQCQTGLKMSMEGRGRGSQGRERRGGHYFRHGGHLKTRSKACKDVTNFVCKPFHECTTLPSLVLSTPRVPRRSYLSQSCPHNSSCEIPSSLFFCPLRDINSPSCNPGTLFYAAFTVAPY